MLFGIVWVMESSHCMKRGDEDGEMNERLIHLIPFDFERE